MSNLEFWKDLSNIFDAVLDYQKKNVEFNNRFINPWIRLGNIFERDDRNSGAVQAYKHATEIDPESAQNWADLGDAHFQAGDHNDAIAAYRKAIEIDPEAGWPLGNLALTLVAQGNVADAIPLYQRSIALLAEPKDQAVCWNRLGNAYRKLDDYENAFNAFKKADELDGDNTGFSDKLDELPAEAEMVAPEEILEQLIAEQPAGELVEAVAAAPEVADESEQEISQVEAEMPAQVESENEPLALAPNMAMNVEELAEEETSAPVAEIAVAVEESASEMPAAEDVNETAVMEEKDEEEASPLVMHEQSLEALKVVEELIAKVEERFNQQELAEQNAPVASEEPALETVEEVALTSNVEATQEIEAVAEAPQVVSEAAVQEVEAVAEAAQEVESVSAQIEALAEEPVAVSEESAPEVESVAAQEVEAPEVETPVASSEEADAAEESYKIPTWLAIKNVAKAFEKSMTREERAEAQSRENFARAETVTTISEVLQDMSVSESAAPMDMVETYTEPLVAQLASEPVLSEEAAFERSARIEDDAVAEQETLSAVESESAPAEEAVEEFVTEVAYEEYLKDVAEPGAELADHVIQNAAPLQVSQNGEVRIAMDTKNAHVWNELGNVYMNSGSYDDAIASYSKAIELDRNFAWPYSNLALAYVQMGRFAEAILFYQRGIELFTSDKDKATTWNRLGNVYRRINDYSNAIAAYKVADELDPENTTLSLRASFGLLGNMYAETTSAYAA